jgi:hypothetical protein
MAAATVYYSYVHSTHGTTTESWCGRCQAVRAPRISVITDEEVTEANENLASYYCLALTNLVTTGTKYCHFT